MKSRTPKETAERVDKLLVTLHRELTLVNNSKANAYLTDFIKGTEESQKIAKLKHKIK